MNDAPAAVVRAKGLRKEYGGGECLVRALDAVDLDVNRGEAVAVMGPSGCGKLLSALPGAIVGVPLGIELFTTAVKGGALPAPLWLVAIAIGTLVVMAALTIVPARISSMRSIAGALQSEAA
jgi:hypothetical protein